MSDQKFSEKFTVGYGGIQPDGSLSPYKILDYMQEIAFLHTESTDYSMKWYGENGRGWLLSFWNLEIYQYPKWKDEIKVSTWMSAFKGILGERNFEMLSADGKKLACGVSKWVYMDMQRRRPIRPSEGIIAGWSPCFDPVIPVDFTFPDYGGFTLVGSRNFTATRRETDTNRHVNNEKYVEWAMDDVPDEVYYSCFADKIKVAYKKECAAGNAVRSDVYAKETDGQTEYVSVFTNEQEGAVYAEVYSQWRSR